MKGSRLISDIAKGEWLIDIHQIEAYFPLIQKITSGEKLNINPEPKSILSYIDSSGAPVQKNENGQSIIPNQAIAVVSMIGEVVKNGDYCVYGADEIVAALTKANNNPNVLATIFKIDGPGGAVSAIGLFEEFARDVKTKPIIGLCDSALSLHYWTAVEVCDHIMAENNISARFGSVGVVLTFADTRKAMEEKGYTIHEIYPEESSHKNLPYQHARDGKYELIRSEFLAPLAKKFQSRVRAKLPNIIEEEGTLKGKTYFADEALQRNMIHSIGGMKKAVAMATILSTIKN